LALRFILPKELSLLHKVLFSVVSGLCLVVLIPQNLVYLGVPVRISAWLILGAALVQGWLCRRKFGDWLHAFYSNADIRTLALVTLLSITFHGIVPIRQGLEWYSGTGHFDQLNYALLAEFLKEEPYGTSGQDIGLRPWLVRTVGFKATAEELGMNSGPGAEMIGLKKQRIGQSIVTAEISVWSGTNGKGGYAATVIFFLTLLAICVYTSLRETGIGRFMAGSGALLAAMLPAVTRISLDGFLSQVSVLFVFPFFASLLRRQEFNARSFTLLFSLTLAYFVAAYSEMAPIGFCTLFLGVVFIRQDTFRAKRLILMSVVLFIALANLYYLRNLIEFLGQQYYLASNAKFLDNLAPGFLTLRDWSELLFGVITSAPLAVFFGYCTLGLGLLVFTGAIVLSKSDKLVFGAILLPALLVVLYLATRTPPSSYPMAKITLTILPFVIGLVFVALSRIAAISPGHAVGVLIKLFCAVTVAGAAAGSVRYYSEVLNNRGLLRYVRQPRFQNICRELEETKNKRVLLFENDPLLIRWLCYHARHNAVYLDGRFINDSSVPPFAAFARVPDLSNLDLVATRDRLVDLTAPDVSCLTLIDDLPGEDRIDDHARYWLGPPAGLRFLALGPMSANLKMRFAPGPEATVLPIDFLLTDDQGHVSRGEIRGETIDVRRMNFPKGPSYMQLSVKAKESEPNATPSFPIVAVLDGVELSDIDLNPGKNTGKH
jgi:hypothetical protein